MGGLISKAVDLVNDKDEEKKTNDAKAELELLIAMAKKQEEIFTQKLINYYAHDEQYNEYQVVGGRLVQRNKFFKSIFIIRIYPQVMINIFFFFPRLSLFELCQYKAPHPGYLCFASSQKLETCKSYKL